jgi:retron-type reverse transcriptase
MRFSIVISLIITCAACNLTAEPQQFSVKYYSENIIKITYAKVFEMDNIVEGFNKVKNKKSGGVDKQLKADITEAKLAKLQKVLKTQRYKPKPSRRVTIPKPGGGVRFLGIASTIDKIVQAVLVNLLTPIVEPTFSIHSYGFRPGKGCHDALFKIRNG